MNAEEKLVGKCQDIANRFARSLAVPELSVAAHEKFAAALVDRGAVPALREGIITPDEAAAGIVQLLHVELLTAAGLPLDYSGPGSGDEVLKLRAELALVLREHLQEAEDGA